MSVYVCECGGARLTAHSNLCVACLPRLALAPAVVESHEGMALEAERLGPIGQGPNGIVYLARLPGDPTRFVTLKVIERPVDATTFVRLMREIITGLASGAVRGVSRLLDADVMPGGDAVVCAEYAAGRQIDHFFRTAVTARARLGTLAGLCEQVAGLHEAEIVHGAIKVQNVIVAERPGGAVATLLDTGIAPALDASCGAGLATHAARDATVFQTGKDRDIRDLQRLVLDGLPGEASTGGCGGLLRRLQRSACSSAAALGAELHAAALSI